VNEEFDDVKMHGTAIKIINTKSQHIPRGQNGVALSLSFDSLIGEYCHLCLDAVPAVSRPFALDCMFIWLTAYPAARTLFVALLS
jgi:hypothetical protein